MTSKRSKAFIRTNNLKYSDYANPNATRRYPLPSIIDGTYFEICPEYQLPLKGDTDKLKAMCKICHRIICGTLSVTTNFKTHLRRLHTDILDEFEKYKTLRIKRNRLSRSILPKEPCEMTLRKRSTLKLPIKRDNNNDFKIIKKQQQTHHQKLMQNIKNDQMKNVARSHHHRLINCGANDEKFRSRSINNDRTTIDSETYNKKLQYDDSEIKLKSSFSVKLEPRSAKQQQFDRNLVDYIIMSMKPFSTVDDPHFIKMIKDLDPEIEIMSRQSFEQCITEKYNLQIEREQY